MKVSPSKIPLPRHASPNNPRRYIDKETMYLASEATETTKNDSLPGSRACATIKILDTPILDTWAALKRASSGLDSLKNDVNMKEHQYEEALKGISRSAMLGVESSEESHALLEVFTTLYQQ